MCDLSIIIPSYNTRDITKECLEKLVNCLKTGNKNAPKPIKVEIIVVDNASGDGSIEMLREMATSLQSNNVSFQVVYNETNTGYSKGNNIGLQRATGAYILYLNSDVYVDQVNFNKLLEYMDSNPKVGALTVRVNLANGDIDPASHRGFPTVWRSLTYFVGLENATRSIPVLSGLFGGYHLTSYNLATKHQIDAGTGAFLLTRKSLMDTLKGFDESFFMYGEDLDLCYRIKEASYVIEYDPEFTVLHLKYKSGMSSQNEETRKRTRTHFHDAMKLFYRKHYEKIYPVFVNRFIYYMIDLKNSLS
jgi:GT2 family glycosyltransferase